MKEASETEYWLEVTVEADMLSWTHIKSVYEKCKELLAIFEIVAILAIYLRFLGREP